jgi:hypothetical protein
MLVHEGNARTPLLQVGTPWQSGESQLPQADERGGLQGIGIRISQLTGFEDQFAQTSFTTRPHELLPVVPGNVRRIRDMRGKQRLDVA